MISDVLGNKRLLLACVFIFSVLIQLSFLVVLNKDVYQRNQSSDYAHVYAPVAENILLGKGVVDNNGKIAMEYPPGYSVLLSVIYLLSDLLLIERLKLVAVFNIFITSLSCMIVFLISNKIFNEKIALITAILWITYPFNLWIIKQPNTEVPFTLLFYSMLYVFIRFVETSKFTLSLLLGIIIGLSALVRPIATFMPLLMIVVFYIFRKRLNRKYMTYSFLTIIGFFITIMPWEIHLYKSTGRVILLSTSGIPSILDGLTFANHLGADGDRAFVPSDVRDLMERISENPNLKTIREIGICLLKEFKTNPVTVLKLVGIKLCRSWYGTDEMWYENYTLFIQSIYLLMGLTGVFLILRYHADKKEHLALLLLVMLYFYAMSILVLSILRYMVPAMISLMIFSAVAIEYVLRRTKRGCTNKPISRSVGGCAADTQQIR